MNPFIGLSSREVILTSSFADGSVISERDGTPHLAQL
jgi:hypothetical protein